MKKDEKQSEDKKTGNGGYTLGLILSVIGFLFQFLGSATVQWLMVVLWALAAAFFAIKLNGWDKDIKIGGKDKKSKK